MPNAQIDLTKLSKDETRVLYRHRRQTQQRIDEYKGVSISSDVGQLQMVSVWPFARPEGWIATVASLITVADLSVRIESQIAHNPASATFPLSARQIPEPSLAQRDAEDAHS
jgi:hypothetical protein